MTKRRYIINFSIILILAVATGLFAGNYYNTNYGRNVLAPNVSEAVVRGNDLTVALKKAKGNTPENLSATENFVVAENILNNRTAVKKEVRGEISAAGIKQTLVSQKILVNGDVYADKISASSMVKVAQMDYYKTGTTSVNIYDGKVTSSTTATWPTKASKTVSLDEYKSTYGISPERMISLVVGTNTVVDESPVTKNEQGNYTATITLDTNYSVMNYMYEIKATAGSKKLPYFKSVVLTYEIDENWNLISYTTTEVYDVSIAVLGFTTCKGTINNSFTYEDVEIPQI